MCNIFICNVCLVYGLLECFVVRNYLVVFDKCECSYWLKLNIIYYKLLI